MSATVVNRKIHRMAAILVAMPFLVIVLSGILLQLKKDVSWIQPPTREGTGSEPLIAFSEILRIARGVPEATIEGWDDIDRIDVRPAKGMVKVRARNRCEIQIDATTGAILQVAERRSDVIESIHDGTIFFDGAKLSILLPVALFLLVLLGTGTYLFFLPQISRRKRNRRRAGASSREKP